MATADTWLKCSNHSLYACGRGEKVSPWKPPSCSLLFFSYPLHFAVLLSPFSLFYSYHFHQFPFSFCLPLNPGVLLHTTSFQSTSVTSLSTILFLSLHDGVTLSLLLEEERFIISGKMHDSHFTHGETVLPPPTFIVMTTPPPFPPFPPLPICPWPFLRFSDLYVHITDLPP